ncbi:long-chain fatty acid--CoA ligase [Nonomuraea sp. SYSU D8015]|uniref:long-chain fatty acid--CoA ligase n=1 Tax=Nonomuraea sp. SYSU D8015 TaxID=2593644 RepID=UPI001CB709F5|nr:long-chain fatty acid--CoA ligase [Nonomuraea sp. SYSU D8015]
MYTELEPAELLGSVPDSPVLAEGPWTVRWDIVADKAEKLVLSGLPPEVELSTSGSTGAQQRWLRTREQLWAEAGLLAELLRPARPQAMLSFAPPRHLYGILVSVLVPARLGLPVWYRSQYGPMPPEQAASRWAVAAIPWTFSLLLQRLPWVLAAERIAVLHSTAILPATAAELAGVAQDDRLSITEIFGSTETGGVATRRWALGDPPWELFPDVAFAAPDQAGEAPLTVLSPRLARAPEGEPLAVHQMDDHVEILDERRFRFAGRRSRLVNVNGRRINLDELENAVRAVLPCRDLALVPVRDAVIGEHFDLLLVPRSGVAVSGEEIRRAFAAVGVRPRKLRTVERIDRSETGKLRRVQD